MAIIVPYNYSGKVAIKFNDSHSHLRISPINNQLYIPLNSLGKFRTRPDFDIKLNTITVIEMKNHHFCFPGGVHFYNSELLTHDSTDGKYTLLKGDIVLMRDSTAAEKQKAATDTSSSGSN